MLRDAAVIGRGFWPAAVAADRRSRTRGQSTTSFTRSSARSSFVASRTSVDRGASSSTRSITRVVRDVAYSSIPRAERAQKHWLAATWIESLGRPEDHAETIAHHYLSALEFARGSRQPTDELASKARVAFRAAGERALALNAPEAAALLLRSGARTDVGRGTGARGPALPAGEGSLRGPADPTSSSWNRRATRSSRRASSNVLPSAASILGDVHWRQGRPRRCVRASCSRRSTGWMSRPYAKAYALATLSRIRNAADEPQAAIALGRRGPRDRRSSSATRSCVSLS